MKTTGPSAGRARFRSVAAAALAVTMLAMLAACSGSSGNGGDDDEPKGPPASPQSLVFTYPYNGQQDVPRATQIVATFGTAVTSDVSGFNLVETTGDENAPAIEVVQDDNQPNIYRITPVNADGEAVKLDPETSYAVRLSGNTLFQFTTRPIQGRPAGDEPFAVVARTPGSTNPVTGVALPFTEFNTVRLRLSAPVDPATVAKGTTFTFTDAAGNVIAGRLTALGRYITFDPLEDLDSSKTYTLALTGGVVSAFGESLAPYTDTLTPLDTGTEATQNLNVKPTGPIDTLPDNPLNGTTTNVAVIKSQLIGVNRQVASNATNRGGVTTTLAEPGMPGFGTTVPSVIRAGQKVQLSKLELKLSGVVDTPITSGPIDSVFINDVDVYLLANQLRDGKTPTAVRLRFDLGIATQINAPAGTRENVIESLANGLFNQTVLNIQAAGTAVAAENGDLIINTVGSFPIKVNRVGTATIDLELRLILPGGDQRAVDEDATAPFVTAQFPSACLYLFGTPAYYAEFPPGSGIEATTATPEKICAGALQAYAGATPPFVNSFPIESSPYILFSEPLDPTSVSPRSVTLLKNPLTSPTPVRVALSVEGTSIVIDPLAPLEPDTSYGIALNQAATLTDYAGNAATAGRLPGGQGVALFTTEPLVDAPTTPPFIGSIMPGLPCALAGGDFMNGGNTAGNCVGDSSDNPISYPVFDFPANLTVDIFLSRFASTDSIVLADGCLVRGSDDIATTGSVAVQHMDGSGNCLGVVEGELVPTKRGAGITRGFSFRPTDGFEVGERYWVVICGTDGNCVTSNRIQGAVTGLPINTDPLRSGLQGPGGGPTLIMPFDAVEPTEDFYATQRTVPYSDTNGNGMLDDGERPQPANEVVNTVFLGPTELPEPFSGYLSLSRPVAIRDHTTACDAVSTVVLPSGEPAVGAAPEQCIPVSLLPGGLTLITSIEGLPLAQSTGPVILRYPYVDGEPQKGYIVEQCSGTFEGEEYHYAPCFVANLTQTVNAPSTSTLIGIEQQTINVRVFGPVSFEQNGRQVISLINANEFQIDATVNAAIPAPAVVYPGELHFQLAAVPSHGGRAFPLR